MKKTWILTIIIIIIFIISSIFFIINKNTFLPWKNKIIKKELEKIEKENLIKIENEIKKDTWIENKEDLTKKVQIELLKKRFALRNMISSSEELLKSNQFDQAIILLKKILAQTPNDTEIIKKIAFAYFSKKDFKNSLSYYEKIINNLDKESKRLYILSLLYSLDTKNNYEIKKNWEKINNLDLNLEEKFYYINSLNCLLNEKWCIKNFEDYFIKNTKINFEPLLDLKNSIDNYNNFQSNEPYYKDSLITWSYFKNEIYPIAINFWNKILSKFPDYNPILIIVWKSYYEIWDYNNAKDYLLRYYTKNPNDEKISFLLWNISFILKDYVASNIYFQTSLKNNHPNKLEIQRKLAYNYYMLWDKRSMLNIFSDIIKDKNSNINDFSLRIYWAILEWRNLSWINWANKWIEKFNKNNWYEIFYWYLWWIYREEKDFVKREEYLSTWFKINPKNPLITLNYWYLEAEKENYKKALIYFKKTQLINWNWEFWELATKEIKEIQKYLNLKNLNIK